MRSAPRKSSMMSFTHGNMPRTSSITTTDEGGSTNRPEISLIADRVDPGSAIRAGEVVVGVVVADDLTFDGIPGEAAPELHREVCQDARGSGDVALFDVGDGLAARSDGGKKILHVAADGGGYVCFEVFLGLILRILFELVGDIFVDELSVVWLEVVAHDAGLESAFVPIEGGAPLIFWIGWIAPGAMLPDNLKIAEIERRLLSVGDIGFALFVDENAAGRADVFGPAEIEHPANHVEHVDTHVADDAVAVFHKGAPASGMAKLVVGTHRGRASPHFVIEIVGRSGVRRILPRAHVVVTIDFDESNLSELSFLEDIVAGFDQMRSAAALGADLDHTLILARGGEHGLTFSDIDADRLLAVNVRAGFDGGDHSESMPMIRGSDEDDVEVLFFQHLAVIGVGAGFLFRFLACADHFSGIGEHVLVDVTKGDDLDRSDLDEAKEIGLAGPAR